MSRLALLALSIKRSKSCWVNPQNRRKARVNRCLNTIYNMESFIFVSLGLSLFLLGVGVGAIIENTRLNFSIKIVEKINETQEILLPLADKISHADFHASRPFIQKYTLVDYDARDPNETMEIPMFEKLQEEKWLSKNQKNLED